MQAPHYCWEGVSTWDKSKTSFERRWREAHPEKETRGEKEDHGCERHPDGLCEDPFRQRTYPAGEREREKRKAELGTHVPELGRFPTRGALDAVLGDQKDDNVEHEREQGDGGGERGDAGREAGGAETAQVGDEAHQGREGGEGGRDRVQDQEVGDLEEGGREGQCVSSSLAYLRGLMCGLGTRRDRKGIDSLSDAPISGRRWRRLRCCHSRQRV